MCGNYCGKNLSIFLLAFFISVLFVNIVTKHQNTEVVIELSEKLESKINYEEGNGSCRAKGYKKELNCFACGEGHNEEQKAKTQTSSIGTALQILSKPIPAYTDSARTKQSQGVVKLRVTFNANETIGNISVIEGLPDGLTEQAIEAARQIKFKAFIKNGNPQTVIKQVQYNFTLY